jgi:tetratricopeptide (TPR) repeat protein
VGSEISIRDIHELGQTDRPLHALAHRGGQVLASAGRRALGRDDFPAAVSLFERADALLAADLEQRVPVLIDLGLALREAGRLVDADRAFVGAEASSDERLRCRAALERSSLRTFMDPAVETDALLRVANHAIEVFEEAGDELGLARAWLHVAEVQWLRCHCAEMEAVLARGLVHAERAGERREISSILALMAPAALVGPRPVGDAIEVCRGILQRSHGTAVVEGNVSLVLAVLEAMRGRSEAARTHYAQATSTLEDRGLTTLLASLRMYAGMVELLAGDFEAAERELRLGYDTLAVLGHSAFLSTTAAFLAKPLYELGRYEDALEMTRASDAAASPDDIASQVIWRGTRAKILARQGDERQAASLAQEAVELLDGTDLLNTRADALADLAKTMSLLGREEEAAVSRSESLALYEAKGNLASARAIRQT